MLNTPCKIGLDIAGGFRGRGMDRYRAYQISRIIVVVFVAGLLLWTLAMQLIYGIRSTVSFAVWEFSREAPFVPFLVGFFMAHLFWGTPLPKETREAVREWEEEKKRQQQLLKESKRSDSRAEQD